MRTPITQPRRRYGGLHGIYDSESQNGGYTMEIIRRIVDLEGIEIGRDMVNTRVESRQEAEKYIQDHVAKVFQLHGYNEEHGYWWGRQDDDTQISRFTIES